MKTNKKAILGIAAIIIAVAACVALVALPKTAMAEDQADESKDISVFYPTFVREGYDSMLTWKKAVEEYSETITTKGNSVLDAYGDYYSAEDKAAISTIIRNAGYGSCFARLNEYSNQLDTWEKKGAENKEAAEKAAQEAAEKAAKAAAKSSSKTPSSSGSSSSGYYSNGSGLTKSSGVNYYDGRKETYYSSKVLHHYRTNEWSLDSEGFYRTSNGYYVVAASDKAQGSTFQGSKGTCIVLDSGCAGGTTDYYVGW